MARPVFKTYEGWYTYISQKYDITEPDMMFYFPETKRFMTAFDCWSDYAVKGMDEDSLIAFRMDQWQEALITYIAKYLELNQKPPKIVGIAWIEQRTGDQLDDGTAFLKLDWIINEDRQR